MPVIRIELNTNTSPKMSWKLADASLHFTAEDGPLLDGLTLSGFTIAKSSEGPGTVNITPPHRVYPSTVTDEKTGEVKKVEKRWHYLHPTDFKDKPRMDEFYQKLADAYFDIVDKTR